MKALKRKSIGGKILYLNLGVNCLVTGQNTQYFGEKMGSGTKKTSTKSCVIRQTSIGFREVYQYIEAPLSPESSLGDFGQRCKGTLDCFLA
jgi:hypothetical protein